MFQPGAFLKWLARPQWLAQLAGAAVLAGAAALYFFWYVPGQREYFERRDFRVLALSGEQIQNTVGSFPSMMVLAAKSIESETNSPSPSELDRLGGRVKRAMDLVAKLSLPGTPKVEAASDTTARAGTNILLRGSRLELEIRTHPGTNTRWLVTIRAFSDVGALTLLPPEFDGLLLVRESGEVIHQQLPPGLNVQALNLAAGESPGEAATNLVRQATRLRPMKLADRNYKVFIQPLPVPLEIEPPGTNRWHLCGLVAAERLRAESLEVSYSLLIACIFLVLFVVLSLVYPRVAFAGPHEPLRRRHALLLLAGTWGSAALLAILMLDWMSYMEQRARHDDGSAKLAGLMRSNLVEEIGSLRQLLSDLDGLKKSGRGPATNILTRALAQTNIAVFANRSRAMFDLAFWVREADGLQTDKWTVRETATAMLSVKERNYFKDASKDQKSVWSWQENGSNAFWIEPIRSLTTGKKSVILARRSGTQEIAAVEGPLQTVLDPVLPAGLGFAVITPDGQVLFHSETWRNLRENLFDECDRTGSLRAAVASRAVQDFNIGYRGRAHHFHLTPVPHLSWTLIVFRERQVLRAANFEQVLFSLMLFAFFILAPAAAVLGLAGLWWLWRRASGVPAAARTPSWWFWPEPGRRRAYLVLAAVNFFLFAVLEWCCWRGPTWFHGPAGGWTLLVATAVLAWLGVGVGGWWLRRGLAISGPVPEKWFPGCCLALLLSWLFLLAVAPAMVCFRVAQESGQLLFTKHSQFTFARALTERATRLPADLPPDYAQRRIALDRSATPWGIYAAPDGRSVLYEEGTVQSRPGGVPPARTFTQRVLPLLPVLRSPVSVESRSLLASRSDDDIWYWEKPAGKLTLRVSNYRAGKSLVLENSLPSSSWPLGLVALTLTGLVLVIPVSFIAHRIFHVRTPRPCPKEPEGVPDSPGDRRAWLNGLNEHNRLALFHVAQNGLLQAHNRELPALLERGLLAHDRGLKIRPEGLDSFVRDHVPPETVKTYDKKEAGQGGWDIAKGPVYVALVAIALLMFLTQPDAYKGVFGIITAFAAAPPAILKLLSVMESEKGKK